MLKHHLGSWNRLWRSWSARRFSGKLHAALRKENEGQTWDMFGRVVVYIVGALIKREYLPRGWIEKGEPFFGVHIIHFHECKKNCTEDLNLVS